MSEDVQSRESVDVELDSHPTDVKEAEAPASESRRSFIKTAAVTTGAVAAVTVGDGAMHELDLV